MKVMLIGAGAVGCSVMNKVMKASDFTLIVDSERKARYQKGIFYNGTKLDVVTFGPLAIHPDFQRKGFGKILVDYSLEKAKDLGYPCVFICGNGEFYGKSGFVPATTKGIRYADDPEGEALYFLCKELKESFSKDVYGIYHDPKGYFIPHEKPEAFEKYESTFPKKEKLKLPGHIFG